jgi:hypothetical protein
MKRAKLAIIDEFGVLDPDARIAEVSLPSRLSAAAIRDAVTEQVDTDVPPLVDGLVATQVPLEVAPLVETQVETQVAAQVPPLVQSQVPPLVATAIAADATVVNAAAAAVTSEIADRDMLEGDDPRVPLEHLDDVYNEVFIDAQNRLALGIKKTGEVNIPHIETQSVDSPLLSTTQVTISDEAVLEPFASEVYLSGTVDSAGRAAEDVYDLRGRKPNWVLNEWKARMAALPPSTTALPPMDILVGAGQSNMGASDLLASGVEAPEISPLIYMYSPTTRTIINVRTASAGNRASWIPRALYAFAVEYVKNQLQPGRAVLMVNSGVGSSGFSTTSIVPAPAGYYNVNDSQGNPRTDVGSWEVGFTADPYNNYVKTVNWTTWALADSPATSAVKAFLWSQGESDTGRTPIQYTTQLDLLLNSFRTAFSVPTLPALIGSMVPDWVDTSSSAVKAIQTALEDTPRRVERTAYAFGPGGLPDFSHPIHWSAQGQLARGPIFWDAYLRSKWNVIGSEPIPPQQVTAKRLGPNVKVTWEHPPSAITTFKLEYKIDAGGWTEATLSGPAVREHTLSLALTSAQVATVRLSTTNSIGTSIPTREVQA